ncbi:MAG: hypothetical protein A2736_03000 [Candidatus Yanofskybacteria bacterium RIFCSPHIGHO2_01_FULL_41_27]|uniref:O-antigen ligase-related domain-containing protein n=2 Tax=Candidatus Yanofskyibacteriota TaxID=1752733 RepID=A0A1F8EIN6_9BACT|nr:MAG: hypothetical protein A2736_03000 [Candidatus Yanofskybacteria bacterium RIFCSPHIGHO2_01_FULL_41_27]OGN10151.1 MAG: hypothetical protein A3C64_02460 [Candidatus Yanofskybacteria bacterium RIFCSPHIGHO2_02_FULL_41_12]
MNIIRKIEEILFYFLLFAVPFQTRKILWQENWYFNEWQTISLYLTDLIFLVLFVFWILFYFSERGAKWKFLFTFCPSEAKRGEYSAALRRYQEAKPPLDTSRFAARRIYFRGGQIFNFHPPTGGSIFNKFSNFQISKFFQSDFFLTIFLVVAAISIKNSSSPIVSFFQFLKLFEFILFYFYIKSYAFYRFSFSKTLLALFAGGIFQSVIAIGQFIKQSDLGLRILGESVLMPSLSGVASFFNSAGEKIIRAYGTTPHPNILAAYLFLSIFAFYFLFLYKKDQNEESIIPWGLPLVFYFLMLFGLFFSFSRTVVFLWAAGFTAQAALIWLKKDFRTKFWRKSLVRRRLILILIVTIAAMGIFATIYWPEVASRSKLSSDDEAVQLRIFYGKESLKSGLNLFGSGVGNFVNWFMKIDPNLPRYLYQPVHNIYLLIYSEIGILGLASFVLFLIFLIKDFVKKTGMKELYHYSFLLFFLSVLIIGFFDHFLFTIQQGRFIFWMIAALIASFQNRA